MVNLLDAALVVVAGLLAGAVNAVVGAGSLITFSTLVALGFPPLAANISSTLGLVPGSLSSAVGYRREYAGQRTRLIALLPASALGGFTGAILLLWLPAAAFNRIVPLLVLFSCAIVITQPMISRALARRDRRPAGPNGWLRVVVFAISIYGGYFGAGAGFMFIAVLSTFLADELKRLNALRNLLAAVLNTVASIVLVALSHVAVAPVLLVAIGAIAGGQIGAAVGRRIDPQVLRLAISVFGVIVAARLFES